MARTLQEINAYKMQWAKENKDKVAKAAKDCYLKNKERLDVYRTEWKQSPRGKYQVQQTNARNRGIPWEFTFETWWKVWEDSGKWEERGAGKYMMCRTRDTGPYSPDNVRIDTCKNNHIERAMLRREKNENPS